MNGPGIVGFDPLRDKTYQSTRLGRDVADFLAWLELGGASPRTLDQYERDLARGALMFPDKGVSEVDDGDMLQIARTFKPGERRVRVAAWRSFFKWAVRRRVRVDNPCDALPDLRQRHQPVIQVFPDAEIEALLALPVLDAAPLAVLLEAGLRKAEARHLRLRDCPPESGRLVVLKGKGSRDRIVPMSGQLRHLLNELVLLERLNPDDHIFYAVRANQRSRKVMRSKPVGEGTFARWWASCLASAGVAYRFAAHGPPYLRHPLASARARHRRDPDFARTFVSAHDGRFIRPYRGRRRGRTHGANRG